ncbi:hypothetical protein RB195_022661 [Necator americanus]|uniref:Uncharacterized protein n=1 Tax=Necator americanus TaxID=51031 RepID=A0ABR1EGS6_NECAM
MLPSLRLLLQIFAILCIILGLIIIFIAMATPAWQVAYVRELQQWLQSGLWISCQTRLHIRRKKKIS